MADLHNVFLSTGDITGYYDTKISVNVDGGGVLEGLDGSVLDTVIRSNPGLTMTQNYSTDILRGPGNQDSVFFFLLWS